MGAYLVWFPNAPVRTLIFLVFPIFTTISAKWLLGVWFLTQFFTSPNSGVAWAAHVGGCVFDVAVGVAVRTTRAVQRVRKSVVLGKSVFVRVDIGGYRITNNKKT